MFSFATIASNNSLYNTLPIFNLYVATLVLQSLVTTHAPEGLKGQESIAVEKARLIYAALDAHPDTYHVVPARNVRSRMNICFRITGSQGAAAQPDEAKEKAFLAGAEKKGLLGLKGHRSVGGIRASNYNAVPLENAKKLVAWLEEFAKSG
jgi:phosphoserine aminotransferase